MKNIHVDLGKQSYDIIIQRGIRKDLGESVRKLTGAEKIAVITDDTVDCLYGPQLEETLRGAGLEVGRIAIPAGEQSKNLSVLAKVYDRLSDFGLTRSDAIVTLGGGVPGDLGGFAAATYLRGVPFIQIPTTILAQVDSSVGGKVAVDLPSGKNLAGSFYQPKAVFIDPDMLETLPSRVLHDGLSEAVKYGCIKDAALFSLFEALTGDGAVSQHFEEIIYRCCSIKARLVEEDERDTGARMLLNFGHTMGHAIERHYKYGTYTHGEGVAIGMALLTARTEALGLTEAGTAERIRQVLQKLDLPVAVDVPTEELLRHIGQDKKKRGHHITLVVLERIGEGRLLPIDTENLREYIQTGGVI